jgi:citrate lyase subunit beta/citryl-CoA lyase
MNRSYLYAPGDSEKLLLKVFSVGADAVILDLEDAVPPQNKTRARGLVREVLGERHALVRINSPGSDLARDDLAALEGVALDIKVPKVTSPGDIAWVRERAPGARLYCVIETAQGILAAADIAASPGVFQISVGGGDLARDLNSDGGWDATLYARSLIVLAARAAGLEPPVDTVYTRLDDLAGLRAEAERARGLGFFGKVALHPRQVPVINEVFTPAVEQIEWAHRVLAAFETAEGAALKLEDGEFVDAPVAIRARRVLELAKGIRHG